MESIDDHRDCDESVAFHVPSLDETVDRGHQSSFDIDGLPNNDSWCPDNEAKHLPDDLCNLDNQKKYLRNSHANTTDSKNEVNADVKDGVSVRKNLEEKVRNNSGHCKYRFPVGV